MIGPESSLIWLWAERLLIGGSIVLALSVFFGIFLAAVMRVGESDARHVARRYERMRKAQNAKEQRRNLDRIAGMKPIPTYRPYVPQPPVIWPHKES